MSRRRKKPRRDPATTGFALVVWFAAAWLVIIGVGAFWSRKWDLLLWIVPGLFLIRMGWGLWTMGRARP